MNEWRSVFLAALAAAALLSDSALAQTGRDAYAACRNASSAEQKIADCSAVIAHPIDRRALERAHLRRGNAYMEVGAFAAAVRDFSALIRINDRVAGYFDNRSNAYRQLGQFSQAMSDADRVVTMASSESFAYRSRALLWDAMREYQAAIRDFDRAIALNPADQGLQVDRARIKIAAGLNRDAIAELSEVLSRSPRDTNALKLRGLAEKATGNTSAATADLTAYATMVPADTDASQALADLQSRSDKDRQAHANKDVDDLKAALAAQNAKVAELNDRLAREAREREELAAKLKTNITGAQAAVTQQSIELRNQSQKLETVSNQANESLRTASAVKGVLGDILLPITEDPGTWISRVPTIPIQQQQFCRIVDRSYIDLEQVRLSNNDIRRNAIFKQRFSDIAALLPQGDFTNWLVRVVQVAQGEDGSAGVVLQLPCRAMLGSAACEPSGHRLQTMIKPASPLFGELEKVSAGDFVVISGTLKLVPAGSRDRPLPETAIFEPGAYCSAVSGATTQDVFVSDLRYLAVLR